MGLFLLILGIVLFVGLVIVHEYGHFIMARRNGVEVEEFGIFFPPRLWSRKTKGGWVFSINALPLGGFVKLKGEHDSDTAPGSFGAAGLWAKVKIMGAGVFMNLVTAYFLLMVLAWLGMPVLLQDQYTVKNDTNIVYDSRKVIAYEVEKGSPADKAGIKQGDTLLTLGVPGHSYQQMKEPQSLTDFTHRNAGSPVLVRYTHDSQTVTKQVELRTKAEIDAAKAAGQSMGYLGVVPATDGYALQRSTWSAPIVAGGLTAQFTKLTFEGLGTALKGLGSAIAGLVTGNTTARQAGQTEASSQVSGPVGIFYVLRQSSDLGFRFMLFIIAIISLSLAIMNFLPIPALDGGKLWSIVISRAIRKPMTPRVEELINALGFVLLMGLIVLITVVDVRRFF